MLTAISNDFLRHNLYWENPERFLRDDPHLAVLPSLQFVHPMDWWTAIPWPQPGIFILTGGRQIGKSTSTKLMLKALLASRTMTPAVLCYLPCDQILDHQQLTHTIRAFLDTLPTPTTPFMLVIDEVTYVQHWDLGIKALADEGWFRTGSCVLTGSDTVILREAEARFPGRRGNATQTNFHLLPLTFRDYVALTDKPLLTEPSRHIDTIFAAFAQYLQCGGYLRAINDLYAHGIVQPSTYTTFEEWIRGDVLRRHKNEEYLLHVLTALQSVGPNQITYSALTQKIGSLSKETLINYCTLLERLDVLFTLQAYDQNTRRGFPRKARKFHFADPFIGTTIRRWLVRERLASPKFDEGAMVEACVAAQFHRRYPTYYIKADGEVDLVVVRERILQPIEVKWSRNVKPHDFRQLKKYRHSVLLSRQPATTTVDGIPSHPLPLFLLQAE